MPPSWLEVEYPSSAKISPHHPGTPTLSGNPHTIVHVYGSYVWVLWVLHFLHCTLHAHGYFINTYLYFWSLHLFTHSPRIPSHLATIKTLRIHDSASVLFVCLFCKDLIVDRYVCIAILLFIVLMFFFFLNKSLNILYNIGLLMMNSCSFFLVWETLYLTFDSKW